MSSKPVKSWVYFCVMSVTEMKTETFSAISKNRLIIFHRYFFVSRETETLQKRLVYQCKELRLKIKAKKGLFT